MAFKYSRDQLKEIFFNALNFFNDRIESDINEQNVRLAFFTPANGIEIYEDFCRSYFPAHLRENYKDTGYFESFAAQAFVGDDMYGVLICESLSFHESELFYMFLHEISHLFCTCNEIDTGNFFEKYCMGSGYNDGAINAGYAIWREAVADIMADAVLSDFAGHSLSRCKRDLQKYDALINGENPNSKGCLSLVIAYTMTSKEVAGTTEWPVAEKAIRKAKVFSDERIMRVLSLVFEKLHKAPFWTITPDFILDLGDQYLMLLTERTISLMDRLFPTEDTP